MERRVLHLQGHLRRRQRGPANVLPLLLPSPRGMWPVLRILRLQQTSGLPWELVERLAEKLRGER